MSTKTLLQLEQLRKAVDREAQASIDNQVQVPRCPCCEKQLAARMTARGPRWACGCDARHAS